MTLSPRLIWTTKICTFFIWLLLGLSLLFWFLRGMQTPSSMQLHQSTVINDSVVTNPESLLKALSASGVSTGSSPEAESNALSSRIRLMGVLSVSNGKGAALLSIDEASADPYKIGEEVLDGWKLQAIEARRVILVSTSDSSQTNSIELPDLNANALGNETLLPNANTTQKNNLRPNNLTSSTNRSVINNSLANNSNLNGLNTNLKPNAGNGIDPNAPNPVINANPNTITGNPTPEPVVVQPNTN